MSQTALQLRERPLTLEELMLSVLRSHAEPVRLAQLIEIVDKATPHSEIEIKEALWELLAKCEVQLTADRKIKSANRPRATNSR